LDREKHQSYRAEEERVERALRELQSQETTPENSEALPEAAYLIRRAKLAKKVKKIRRKLNRLEDRKWDVSCTYGGAAVQSFHALRPE
jgi:hypothetical protein